MAVPLVLEAGLPSSSVFKTASATSIPWLHGVCWGAQHYLFPVYFDARPEFQALPKSLTSLLKLI